MRVVTGKIIKRVNRFTVEVKVGDKRRPAFLPNSGRLEELLVENTPALLLPKEKGLPFKLLAVQRKIWISVDSHLVNSFFAHGVEEKIFPPFALYEIKEKEVKIEGKRLDFLLTNGKKDMLVEVKSCTLAIDSTGIFPDAPTLRGKLHLEILMKALEKKIDGAIVFVLQREDAHYFAPNSATHPEFTFTLYRAMRKGVKAFYIKTKFDPASKTLIFKGIYELKPEEMALREYMTLYQHSYPLFDTKGRLSKEFSKFLKEREIELSEINWKRMLLQFKEGGKEKCNTVKR